MFKLRNPFKTPPDRIAGHALYASVIRASREPRFFNEWQVADTPEGRFEVLALTAFLLLKRLKLNENNKDVAQAVFDIMFEDLDSNLRELGVGDVGISKNIKKLAEGFYGRISVFQAGLESTEDNDALIDALKRYTYRDQKTDDATMATMATFIRRRDAHLTAQSDAELREGRVTFLSTDDKEPVS